MREPSRPRVPSFPFTTPYHRGILHYKYVFSNFDLDTLPGHRDHLSSYPSSSHFLRYLAIHRDDFHLPISELQTSARIILNHWKPHFWSYHRHYPLGCNFTRALERNDNQAGTALMAASQKLCQSILLRWARLIPGHLGDGGLVIFIRYGTATMLLEHCQIQANSQHSTYRKQ